MDKLVSKFINDNNLFSINDTLIIGFSGGADSVCLLHILHSLGYNCIAAHCNFHLRGEESDCDEKFATEFCKLNNIKLEKIDFETYLYAESNKLSIEVAARELRYNWFQLLRQKHNAQSICIAHHSDDSIETALINIIRGTGINGITGIKPKNGYITRPLLGISRNDVEEYIRTNNLNFVTDSTNLENNYTRNKIRNIIIPKLEEINNSFKANMIKNMQNFSETAALQNDYIREYLPKVLSKKKDTETFNINEALKTNHYKLLLIEWLRKFGFNIQTIIQIYDNLDCQTGTRFCSNNYELIKNGDYLILNKVQNVIDNNEYKLELNTLKYIKPFKLSLKQIDGSIFNTDKNSAFLDFSKLQFPLTLRTWREGDYFYPLGMKGKQKLSDFIINNKINSFEKRNVWVVTSNNDIIWVVGHRIDDRYKTSNKTKSILCITKNVD